MQVDQLEIYRSVLEGLQVGVYIVDRDRRLVFWNRGAEQITGHLRQEIMGRHCREHILLNCGAPGTPLCQSAICPLNKTIREGKAQEGNFFIQHKDGQRILVRATHMPVRDSQGAVIGIAGTFQQHQPFNPHRNREAADIGNRSFLEFHLRASLARLADSQVPFSVVCVRLEDWSKFAGLHGKKAASEISNLLTSTIQNEVRDTDFLGWWTDRELLIILSKCDPRSLPMISQRLQRAASACAIQWWGDRLAVSVTIAATLAEARDSLERILQRLQLQ